MAHRNLLRVLPPMWRGTNHYVALEVDNQNLHKDEAHSTTWRVLTKCTEPPKLDAPRPGHTPQLNWWLPTKPPQVTNLYGEPTRSRELPRPRDNNNRLGHSKYPRGQALGHFKNPRVTSFSTSLSTYHRGELKPMQLTQEGKTTISDQILHSQIPPKQQILWGEKRGRTRMNSTNESQDLDAKCSPH